MQKVFLITQKNSNMKSNNKKFNNLKNLINISLLFFLCLITGIIKAETCFASSDIKSCKNNTEIKKLVENPDEFLKKEICFEGEFYSFSTLSLDYSGALRPSKKYISVILLRPNTQVPLSELKLNLPLEYLEKNSGITDLEKNNKIKIKGIVFSTKLGEPWIDILEMQKI